MLNEIIILKVLFQFCKFPPFTWKSLDLFSVVAKPLMTLLHERSVGNLQRWVKALNMGRMRPEQPPHAQGMSCLRRWASAAESKGICL